MPIRASPQIETMQERINAASAQPRLQAWIVTTFSLIGARSGVHRDLRSDLLYGEPADT